MNENEAIKNTEPEGSAPKAAKEAFDWLQCIVAALIFTIILFTFFARIIGVDGSSMYPTLVDKEHVAVSNLFYAPKHGDIVIVRQKTFKNEPLVKRIIGLEGDVIDIRDGAVYRNGEKLDESAYLMDGMKTFESDIRFPVTVAEGCILVMGDNRTGSTDSRSSMIGQIDKRCILGRVYAVILPLNKIGIVR